MPVTKKKVVKKKAPAKKVAKKKAPKKQVKKDVYARERERHENRKRNGGSTQFWAPKDGRSIIRPFSFVDENGDELVFVEQAQHWGLGEDGRENIRCMGDDCAICCLQDTLSEKNWNKVRVRRKFLCNVIVREGGEDGEDVHRVARLPVTVYDALCEYLFDEMADEDPLNTEDGRDFRISRTGEGLKTKYKVFPLQDQRDLGLECEPFDLFTKLGPEADESAQAEAVEDITNRYV
jgi:hypothetical protein